jgi:hypothetical protein
MSMAQPSIPSYIASMDGSSSQHPATTHEQDSLPHDDNLEEDGDDVFSNPDTAELESSRSDATGTTSPTPNSPGPSSPTNRAANNHIAIASQHADPFGTLKQSEYSNSQPKQGINSLTLANLPSPNTSQQLREQFGDRLNVETPKATAASPSSTHMRPQYGRTLSASGAVTLSTPITAGTASRTTTPRLGGHAVSHSTSYLNLSSPHGQPLPSAHDMPSNPREASELSKLFARPPAQSPSDELASLGLGIAPESNGMLRTGTGPTTPLAASSPVATSRLRSRPTTRPSSPDRLSSPPRAIFAGLSLAPLPRSTNANSHPSDLSIFERDIEHRDAGHVLSKQEAIDVAIPSVLDDAVEALTCEDGDQIEIVSPHAAQPMLALSAQALSDHSHSHGRLQSAHISSTSSPALSPSPPLSSTGGADAPPGTMAAQIAERLAMKSAGSSPEESVSALPIAAAATSRHRRPNSDASVSSSSSMRSRSPQASLPFGVQQVLDASNNPTPTSVALRSLSVSPAVIAQSKSTSVATTPVSGSNPHATFTLPAPAVTSSPNQSMTLPTTAALPSLPLPNPFREYSPPTSALPLADGGMAMSSSVSMDGAVITTSESAIMDASLGSLADVIASIPIDSRRPSGSNSGAMNSPFNPSKALAPEEDVCPYSSRAPHSISPNMSPDRSIPGGYSFASSSNDDPNNAHLRTNKSSNSSAAAKKRLSFFSYADIINKTPAEVLDLDAALRQTDESFSTSTTMNRRASFTNLDGITR